LLTTAVTARSSPAGRLIGPSEEEGTEQIRDRVAGLDVHRDQVTVCVRTPGPRGGVQVEKARFSTATGGPSRQSRAGGEYVPGHRRAVSAFGLPARLPLGDEGRRAGWLAGQAD
jgi:hypothetical protein